MEEILREVLGEIKKINIRLDNMEQKFDAIDKRLDNMEQKFDAIDKRFENMEQKFDAIDKRFENMEQKFDAIDKRFENMEQKFAAIDKRFDNMEQKFAAIDKQFENINKKFEAIDKQFKSMNSAINEKFEIIGGKLTEQYDLLAALEHRSEENSAYLTAIGEDVVYVKKDGAYINKRLDHQLIKIAKAEEQIELLKAANE